MGGPTDDCEALHLRVIPAPAAFDIVLREEVTTAPLMLTCVDDNGSETTTDASHLSSKLKILSSSHASFG